MSPFPVVMTKKSGMKPANPRILTINGGSSSIKFALFEAGDSLRRILEGGIERIGSPEATLRVKGLDRADNFSRLVNAPDHTVAVGILTDWIEERSRLNALAAVGHRVVHGGPKYYEPQRITAEMVEELRRLSPFDPDHMPEEILLTEAFHRRFPELPQVACFDTAFHHDMPRVAQLLSIPRHYEAQGVRRYGFHGLSYAFLMEELARVPSPGVRGIGDTHVLGRFLRDVEKLNREQRNFRIFGPDETLSNGLEALFEVTQRQWDAATLPSDQFLAPSGRVMEMLSEHQCEGWLEGYLLTGRHGLFNCYEAFIHIVDSMFNQHAKWLKVTSQLPWRRKIASLNYLLASHVWRQDHNGFTHQDPGFVDHVVNKKAEVVRVYLPPDANCLLSVMDHCLRSRHYVNVVIAGKHPAPQWLTMDAAVKHCTEGISIWQWASSDQGVAPDVVMACCGDVPTLETLAAVSILREHLPDLKIRVVNVVDLMKLQPQTEHPHGLSDMDFDDLFTKDKPVIFAFHAYPWLIHRLTYRRTNHDNIHVRGYKEEGTITTPFDMTVLNDLDRFHLVMDVIDRVPRTGEKGIYLKQQLKDKLIEHKQYIDKYGEDMPEIRNWKWNNPK